MKIRGQEGNRHEIAFVATNSITQGEQAGATLAGFVSAGGACLFALAHRTFACGTVKLVVQGPRCTVVIIGTRPSPRIEDRRSDDYDHVRGEPDIYRRTVTQINGYLIVRTQSIRFDAGGLAERRVWTPEKCTRAASRSDGLLATQERESRRRVQWNLQQSHSWNEEERAKLLAT